ncbi:Holliday junction resolvase RuvX [bacterium]|nr:Holliday junction resolvase RuvX [bacterium]MCI0565828.1 Holliday junction resolvase RuvX [bacterium]
MKLVGIDYGEKRVGIALSDETGAFAFPEDVFQNDRNLIHRIEALCARESVEGIVIGESRDFKGAPNPIYARAKTLGEELARRLKVSVYYEPEFLTSAEAERMQKKDEQHDARAAAILLQSYINAKS